MAYISLSDKEDDISFPPPPSPSSLYENYLYRARKHGGIFGHFYIDASLPARHGRFKNGPPEDPNDGNGKNAYLSSENGKLDATLTLRGGEKVRIEVALKETSESRLEMIPKSTLFDLTIHKNKSELYLILPINFQGLVVGSCELSETFTPRARLLVEDEAHTNNNRWYIHESIIPLNVVPFDTSSVTIESDSYYSLGPPVHVLTANEYQDKLEKDEVVKQAEQELRTMHKWRRAVSECCTCSAFPFALLFFFAACGLALLGLVWVIEHLF